MFVWMSRLLLALNVLSFIPQFYRLYKAKAMANTPLRNRAMRFVQLFLPRTSAGIFIAFISPDVSRMESPSSSGDDLEIAISCSIHDERVLRLWNTLAKIDRCIYLSPESSSTRPPNE
ncbi:hypothetical protein N7478_001307 [Penicillium angulare]|uniref:uncharacterized protein n=1 Tax=Penicillium angulare TaxID=116970 RepID=UPI0025419E99|nr:uncharacterized protein N7478_001307 [Penicillium angulare]KAJ5292056.1 hypothetical protein N7478_001307 [Penicillium angulare]